MVHTCGVVWGDDEFDHSINEIGTSQVCFSNAPKSYSHENEADSKI